MNRLKLLALLIFWPILQITAQDITTVDLSVYDSLIKSTGKAYDNHDYKKAITLCTKLIERGEKYNSDYHKFFGYDMLGTIYGSLEDSIKSKNNAIKALEYAKKSKSDSLVAWASLNLGSILTDYDDTYVEGLNLLGKSISYYKKEKLHKDLYLSYINKAWTLLDYEKLDEAYLVINEAKNIENNEGITKEAITYIEYLLGVYYYKKKQYDLAKKKLLTVGANIETDSIDDLGDETHRILAAINKKEGNHKKALFFLEKQMFYKDKIFASNKIQAIEVASAKFDLKEYKKSLEVAIKEKEYSDKIAKKSQQFTTIFIVAISILILALIGLFLFFRSRRNYIKELSNKNKQLFEAKNKAEKLSNVKSQFFSTVSHELRTPLYGVIGISSILQEDNRLKEFEGELNSLKFSADYLLALINDVLLINKMDYQDLVLEQVPFELNTLIASISNSFKFSLEQNKNKLIVNIDEKVPNNLIGSSVRLSQILMNLIGNAVKFNENGTIWVDIIFEELTKEGHYRTHFIIKDDGIGIPEEKQKVIFEEFSQVENENYSHKGTGLGLPIAKKLLKLHKSDISLKSELGKGSEFSFILDLIENQNVEYTTFDKTATIEDIKKTFTSQYNKTHILIVDDNKINQKVTQRMLEKNSIQSSLANDGEEAIKMVKANTYDLILMDINMPKINGIEATKIIRTFNQYIPIIALTAVEIEEMRTQILASGMNGILSKPYGTSQFLSTILEHLSVTHT